MVVKDRRYFTTGEGLSDASLLFIPSVWPAYREAMSGVKRISVPASPIHVVIDAVGDDDPAWLEPVVTSIVQMLNLEENWDSYGAPEIDRQKAIFGLKLLLSNLDRNSPTPSVVPTSGGSLQFEWHTGGIDLEIEVVSTGRVDVYYENRQNDIEEEMTFASNFIPLAAILSELPASDS